LDENVNPVIAAALRRHGIDVTTTIEMNLRTSSGEEQLEFIRKAEEGGNKSNRALAFTP